MEDRSQQVIGIKDANSLGDAVKQNDCVNSYFLTSEVPELCKEKECICGIDEAGRGPTLGPMVYSVFYCIKEKEDDLKSAGCADSKTLSEAAREDIFGKLCSLKDYTGWKVEVISPKVISNSMLRRQKVSLNEVSHNAAIGLVKLIQESGVIVSELYVDTVGPSDSYQAKIEEALPTVKVTVSKKADSIYPVVSAASICAKVTRDKAVNLFNCSELPDDIELAYGSGYPNDPATKKFLKEFLDPLFGFPQIIRFSWSTAEKIITERGHRVDWDDEDESENTPSVMKFFKVNKNTLSQHKFFKDRNLTYTVSF